MELFAMLALMLGVFWIMSFFARRQQSRMAEAQAQRIEEALVPGAWVRTTSGFYGTVVEVDGDVVTLATPLGDETLWAKRAISGAEEPPFASAQDEEGSSDSDAIDEVDGVEDGEDETPGQEPAKESDQPSDENRP
ncbi:preprotein translocase subunit YajC [Actinomyces slackii]|uniref:Preprotein translocase subunit YajC n=1 Tax=Actinomyces slackii TaxID=52774 RepID=A0A3S4SGB2_9ACTO|nr:preprotein translocase subunit YajC [Actinomyces slackii]VEG75347.1 preprotein translocase subunit YajC [Actinomyces slackii]